MLSWSKLTGFLLTLVLATLAVLVLMTLLPHDKFLRYQALNDGQAPTAYWVYERINRDPTPIDVAFIGTSRTAFSVHSARLQQDLQGAGIEATAANLHIVKTGRNMQYVIAKELLAHRPVKLLVLEMNDTEDRLAHPDFIYLADPVDVINAPLFINLRYFSDLARLPGRQLGLFLDTQLQGRQLAEPTFVPPPYEGPNFDHAEYIVTLDGKRHERDGNFTLAQMQQMRRDDDAKMTPHVLPNSLEWLEYRVPRYYVNEILKLAAAKHVKVVFLYLPRFGASPSCAICLQSWPQVPVLNPAAVLDAPGLWQDVEHLNWEGAKRASDEVARQIAAESLLRPAEALAVAGTQPNSGR